MDANELAQLIASTAKADPDNQGWFTAAEFAERAGKCRYWATQRLTAAVRAKTMVVETRMCRNVVGNYQAKPMYRPAKATAKAGRK